MSSNEVKLIELWIGAGASETLAKDAIKDAPAILGASAVAEVTFQEVDPAAVAKGRAAIAPAVAELQKRFPNILDYESRGSADLRLNASILGTRFGDNDLAEFASCRRAHYRSRFFPHRNHRPFRGHNRCNETLHVLRLMNTGITDATVLRLGALDQLESLNLFGTPVTSASLPAISKLPRLAHLYVGQTSIPQGSALPDALAGKVVF